ncbi:unnamed protein product [Amoebophrya sp. A25]|nr:unnamed protein product [Amoebophrya sp. A25]|eukprot:GSA25T00007164001.1
MGNLFTYSASSSPQEQLLMMQQAAGMETDVDIDSLPRNRLRDPFDKEFFDAAKGICAASTAAATASVILNPFDVVKVRLQVQHQLQKDVAQKYYRGTVRALFRIATEDGVVRGLWAPGLPASVCRDILNGGLRVGMYPAVRDTLEDFRWAEPDSAALSFSAGLLTGTFGSFVANPFDLIKTRFQAEGGRLERVSLDPQSMQDLPQTEQASRTRWEPGTGTTVEHDQLVTRDAHLRRAKNLPPAAVAKAKRVDAMLQRQYPNYPYNVPPSNRELADLEGATAEAGAMHSGPSSSSIPSQTGTSTTSTASSTSSGSGKQKYNLRWFSSCSRGASSRSTMPSVYRSSTGAPSASSCISSPTTTSLFSSVTTRRHLPRATTRQVLTSARRTFLEYLIARQKRKDVLNFFLQSGKDYKLVYATGLYKGSEPQFRNTWEAFLGLQADRHLFRGVFPNMVRAALVTAAQITSYDRSKQYLRKEYQMEQGPAMFAICGAISGLCSSVISAPVDIVKTRVMNDRPVGLMVGQESEGFQFKGSRKCLLATINRDGIFALYRGFVATYLRLGPHFVLGWPLLECIRRNVFGLEYF